MTKSEWISALVAAALVFWASRYLAQWLSP